MNLLDHLQRTLPPPLAAPEASVPLAIAQTSGIAVRWAHKKAIARPRAVSGAHLQSPESPGAFIPAGSETQNFKFEPKNKQ